MDRNELERISQGLHDLDRAAALALSQGELEHAFLAYQTLCRTEDALGLRIEAGRTKMNLANLSMMLGRPDEAEGAVREALTIFTEEKQNGAVTETRFLLARVLCAKGDGAAGLKEAEAALRLCKTDLQRGWGHLTILECARQKGDRMKARTAADRAVQYLAADPGGLEAALCARIALFESQRQYGPAAADKARLASLREEGERR